MSNSEKEVSGFWKKALGLTAVVYIVLLLAFIGFGSATLVWALSLNDFEKYMAAFETVVQNTWAEPITATIAAVVAFVLGDKAKQAYVFRVKAQEREAHLKNILVHGQGQYDDELKQFIAQLEKSTL